MNWGTILRNIFSNWASYLVTAVIGFLLTPVIVHSLGNTGYGLWTLVLSLTGYFGLLDLGVRSSLGRFVARYLALNDHDQVNRTASTALTILLLGAALAIGATLTALVFFFPAFKVPPSEVVAAKIALIITGTTIAAALPMGVFSSVLIALDRFDLIARVTILGELLRAALVVSVLRTGHGLVPLAFVALFISVAEYGAMAIIARSLLPSFKLSVRGIRKEDVVPLLNFSVYRFIWTIANQLIFYSDSVVIGIVLSASEITPFAIAGSLINYGRNVVSLVTDTFAPAANRLDAKQDLSGLCNVMILGTKLSLLVAIPLCLGFVFLGRSFIALWMGPAYLSSALFLLILTIPQLGAMTQNVSALILASMARHQVLAYLSIAEGIANLFLSIQLVHKVGLVGIAWGTVIPSLLCTGVILPVYTLRTLHLDWRQYLLRAWLPPLACGIPAAGLAYVFSKEVVPGWPAFFLQAGSLTAVFLGISYFFCFSAPQRAIFNAKITKFFPRQAVAHEI